MSIDLPHIIFNVGGEIKVLKMAATTLHLVKSIRLPGYSTPRRPIDNKFCLGFPQNTNGNDIVHVFQKRELFDPDLSPDETERRRIEVDGNSYRGPYGGSYGGPVNINTTSFLWQRREEVEGEYWMGLVKQDFWI